jgi:RNA polymerase sigma-70 factor (ECF subfamily)
MHLDASDLYRAHAPFVASFLARLGVPRQELEDCVQVVFLTAHRRGGFEAGDAKPTTWLAEIALRVASDDRRTKRRRPAGDELNESAPSDAHSPEEWLSLRQSLLRVQAALDTLSLEHRAVFILYELEGESCEHIASGLQIPIGTVHSRLHAARKLFSRAHERLSLPDTTTVDRLAISSFRSKGIGA